MDELGDGGLKEGGVEGGVKVGFGELDVEIEGDGGEELEGFTSEDLGEVEVDVGADEVEGAQVDALVNGGLGGEVDFGNFTAEDAAIAGLDFEREGVEMVGLCFEPEADSGDEYFADETGAAGDVGDGAGNAVGGWIGHGEVDFDMVREFFTLKDRLWCYRRDGPIEGVIARVRERKGYAGISDDRWSDLSILGSMGMWDRGCYTLRRMRLRLRLR